MKFFSSYPLAINIHKGEPLTLLTLFKSYYAFKIRSRFNRRIAATHITAAISTVHSHKYLSKLVNMVLKSDEFDINDTSNTSQNLTVLLHFDNIILSKVKHKLSNLR
jgi:hypothetical protein